MFSQKTFLAISLLLSYLGVSNAGLGGYIRGGLTKLENLQVDDYAEAHLSQQQANIVQNSATRNLQATTLTLDKSFMSQVNKTYVFPQAINPDCAAGSNVVVGVTQFNIEGVDRVTGEPIFSNSIRWLFRTLREPGLLPSGAEMMTPRVVYDSDADRFVVISTMTDKETYSKVYVAVSKTNAPATGLELDWDVLVIDVMEMVNGQALWASDLAFSVNADHIFVTAMMKTTDFINEIDSFVHSQVWVMKKGSLSSGFANPSAIMASLDGTSTTFNTNIFSDVLVLDNNGAKLGPYVPAASASGAYMIAFNDQATTDDEEVHIISMSGNSPSTTIVTSIVSLGDVDIDALGGPLPGADQPDPEYSRIETGGRKVHDAVVSGSDLYITTTFEDTVGQTAAFWATIDTSSMVVSDSAHVTGETIATGASTYYPSVAVNSVGEAVIGYGASSNSTFAGVYASSATSGVESHVEVKAGEDNFESIDGLSYLGEYSGLSVDPVDDNCFWTLNTFARVNDPLEWHTWERGALAVQWGRVCLQ